MCDVTHLSYATHQHSFELLQGAICRPHRVRVCVANDAMQVCVANTRLLIGALFDLDDERISEPKSLGLLFRTAFLPKVSNIAKQLLTLVLRSHAFDG